MKQLCVCEQLQRDAEHHPLPWVLFRIKERTGWRNRAAMALFRATEPLASFETFEAQLHPDEARGVQDQVSLALKTQKPAVLTFWARTGADEWTLAEHHLRPSFCRGCTKACGILTAAIVVLQTAAEPDLEAVREG